MDLKERVEMALAKIRPSLKADGGDVILIDISNDGVVKVQLKGTCGGCPMSTVTLKMGIERIVRSEVPEVSKVEAV